ncbi:MAG: hypothetical protein Q8R15_01580, partial [Candidatus Micrarchaeota archaeon]|nr:hypothetical protein [Candidatus Micrarchaeota archaeon]
LALMESEDNLISKDLNELRAKQDLTQSDSQNLHRETVRRFIEFADKLETIRKEIQSIEQNLHKEEGAIERIREHEADAVSNVKKWEKKTIASVKKQLTAKKTLDAVLKKLLSGKNKGKLDKAIRTASTSTKVRTSLVNSVMNDKKLRAKLVNDVLVGTRGKMTREKVTTTMANAAAKKVMKTVKPKVRKAARTAARKAVKTEANK